MNGYCVKNQILLQIYLQLVNNLYVETKNEEIPKFNNFKVVLYIEVHEAAYLA